MSQPEAVESLRKSLAGPLSPREEIQQRVNALILLAGHATVQRLLDEALDAISKGVKSHNLFVSEYR